MDSRAVHLGAVFVRGLTTLLMANSACGFPFRMGDLMPWEVFDGKLFQEKYQQSHRGCSLEELLEGSVSNQPPLTVLFEKCTCPFLFIVLIFLFTMVPFLCIFLLFLIPFSSSLPKKEGRNTETMKEAIILLFFHYSESNIRKCQNGCQFQKTNMSVMVF